MQNMKNSNMLTEFKSKLEIPKVILDRRNTRPNKHNNIVRKTNRRNLFKNEKEMMQEFFFKKGFERKLQILKTGRRDMYSSSP